MPWHVGRRVLESKTTAWLVVAAFLIAMTLTIVVPFQVRAYQNCLASWADTYTARTARVLSSSAVLRQATESRDNALAGLIRTIPAQSRPKFETALTAYLRALDDYDHASAKYKQTLARNPVPAPPKFRC